MCCSTSRSKFITSGLVRFSCLNSSHAANRCSGEVILSNIRLCVFIYMVDADIPILKKSYDLYRALSGYRKLVSKQDRFTVFERSENVTLDMVECILEAGYSKSSDKTLVLERASVKLNLLRFFVRLMKE